jgi:hypothetical protein
VKTLRIIVSALMGLVAMIGLLIGAESFDTSSVDKTIANSRKIDSSFQIAAAYVDAHIRETGSPPSRQQFEAWASSFPHEPYTVYGMLLDRSPFPVEFEKKHGQAPKNGYVLSYWRGEWEESYISWTKRSSLVFERAAYFMFSSPVLQAITWFSVALVLAASAFWLWPRKKQPN